MTRRSSRTAGGLTREDAELWELVKQRLVPLEKARSRVAKGQALRSAAPASPTAAADRDRAAPTAKGKAREATAPGPAVPPAAAPRLAGIERRKARKIAAGRLEIAAVLDLHGMRQRDAHAALRAFLREAHGSGKKFVKIITGKGAPARDSAGVSFFEADNDGQRGVLRRVVPQWLEQPDLRAIVVGFTGAGRGQGGDGALIVELRKPARASRA